MTQKLYLDDCAFNKALVVLLLSAGHEVTTPAEAGTTHQADSIHFDYAARHGLVLITKNPKDFRALHDLNQQHAGILGIYQDNDPDRDMSFADIARALGNIEAAGAPLAGTFSASERLEVLTKTKRSLEQAG